MKREITTEENNLIYYSIQVHISQVKEEIYKLRWSQESRAFKDEMIPKREAKLKELEDFYATWSYIKTPRIRKDR